LRILYKYAAGKVAFDFHLIHAACFTCKQLIHAYVEQVAGLLQVRGE
jgi:hypothetical protein